MPEWSRVPGRAGRATAAALAAALAVIAVASCDDSPTSPSTAIGVEQLAGTWTLVSIQAAGQAAQPTPAGAVYTLTFADGRLSTRADCNTCGASVILSGRTLNTGSALACTRAACPTMAFEHVYIQILTGESTVMLSGNTLVLGSARGMLRFTR